MNVLFFIVFGFCCLNINKNHIHYRISLAFSVYFFVFHIQHRIFLFRILYFRTVTCYDLKKGSEKLDIQYQIIGKRIQQRRKELGLKQCQLAEQLNISNNHMSSIETGREKPSLETLLHICDILKVTPDYLLIGNMHTNDIPQDILESLRLCNEDDLKLARNIIELLVERNQNKWNQKHSF